MQNSAGLIGVGLSGVIQQNGRVRRWVWIPEVERSLPVSSDQPAFKEIYRKGVA